jgi:hypothetical protein
MQKRRLLTILGVMLAVVVASLSLVFAVGPRVSADSEVVLNQESYFKINDSHQLTGISDAGKSLINGKKFRVVIPSSVTSIGNGAFSGCSGLTTIDCTAFESKPDGWDDDWLGSCDPSIVQWCPLVFTLTNNDTEYAVTGYRGIPTEIIIPAEWNGKPVTSIGNFAFYNCSGLTSIEIPSSVTSIDSYAFYECSGLTSIEIPSSVTSIGKWAFYDCSGLTTITFAENSQLTSIGELAFYYCSGLTTVTFAGNSQLTSIGGWAFAYCRGLTSIEIPSGVTSFGYYAFEGCSGLTTVTLA